MPIWRENLHHFNFQVLLVSFRERIHRKGNQNIMMFEQICFTKIVVWWWHHKRYLREAFPLISMLSQKIDYFNLVGLVLTFYHGRSPWNLHIGDSFSFFQPPLANPSKSWFLSCIFKLFDFSESTELGGNNPGEDVVWIVRFMRLFFGRFTVIIANFNCHMFFVSRRQTLVSKILYFHHRLPGEMIHFEEHIFQMACSTIFGVVIKNDLASFDMSWGCMHEAFCWWISQLNWISFP